jgi:hypothetical protein
VLSVVDDLINEVKKARTRANNVEVMKVSIGSVITGLVMATLNDAPSNNQV